LVCDGKFLEFAGKFLGAHGVSSVWMVRLMLVLAVPVR
jgi:hypothetical protein